MMKLRLVRPENRIKSGMEPESSEQMKQSVPGEGGFKQGCPVVSQHEDVHEG